MIPVGYMAKRVVVRPANWLEATRVTDVFSVSNCMSDDFADYIEYWAHNGWWLFDSPEIIVELARVHAIDLSGTTLFFYEVFEQEFHEGRWRSFAPEPSSTTRVILPAEKRFEGCDVVTFSAGTSPECSPLSCNALAVEIETNAHCLLPSVERACELLEAGAFENAEPGPRRVFAVYSTKWP